MHKALNETLAALPDDTAVYVRSQIPSLLLVYSPSYNLPLSEADTFPLGPLLQLKLRSDGGLEEQREDRAFKREVLMRKLARPRVHKEQRQVRRLSAAERCDQEAAVVCREQQGNTRQIYYW